MQPQPQPYTDQALLAKAMPASPTTLPDVLIGPMSEDPAESVSSVNRAFVEGLQAKYDFVPLCATRTLGSTLQSRFNVINLFYFWQQCLRWSLHLIKRRPRIAHYAISSGWAMEKGLIYMKLARAFGAKTVGHFHSGEFIDHWEALPKWRRAWATHELKKLDALILASQWWASEIGKHIPIPAEKLRVVNNPIDSAFERAALQMNLERPGNTVLAVGVMCRAKGIFDILEAANIVSKSSSFSISLVGAEREPGIFQAVKDYNAANSLANVVRIRSGISNDEKTELFRTSGILVHPSYYENSPLVLVEAAAAGMAIIATPVGAVPEFFEDGVSALFVEPGNPAQLAAALRKLLENPAERLRLGAAARKMFTDRLARARIMDSLDHVYHRALI